MEAVRLSGDEASQLVHGLSRHGGFLQHDRAAALPRRRSGGPGPHFADEILPGVSEKERRGLRAVYALFARHGRLSHEHQRRGKAPVYRRRAELFQKRRRGLCRDVHRRRGPRPRARGPRGHSGRGGFRARREGRAQARSAHDAACVRRDERADAASHAQGLYRDAGAASVLFLCRFVLHIKYLKIVFKLH